MAGEDEGKRHRKPDFTTVDYWDSRFQDEETYDWLVKYSQIRHLIAKYVSKGDRILMLGCGNSELSAEMYRDGYQNIVNVDFSSVCIDNMREKHKDYAGMEWLVMDITDLKFPDSSFNVVIEKGTLDALVANEKDPWYMSDEGLRTMETTLAKVSQVLKPTGRFISITFSQPHFRRPLFAKSGLNWSIELTLLGEDFHFFFFAMRKGEPLDPKDAALEKATLAKREEHKMDRHDDAQMQRLAEDEDEDAFLFKVLL
ncbi:EEF1A lysine methyltransferase 4-like [Diadema antillarum]|uniref:EEF1A lysine methyltransferase 4-like n=2 Tax=Diadema antillarum TaxID=105358 RepID=UPI003A8B790C